MDILAQLNDEMAGVVEQVQRSLVRVSAGQIGGGAGVIVGKDGLILTNAHVIRSEALHVTLPNGQVVPAELVAQAADYDLAALRVEGSDLPAAALGDSGAVRPGDWVFAVGHPWGIKGAVTSGVVIGAGDRLPEMPRGSREWVATSLHLRPGNSGGPLADIKGHIIGINTVMAGPEVGLAIPSNAARRFIEKL